MKKLFASIIAALVIACAPLTSHGQNLNAQILASTAQTAASVNSADQTNSSWKGAVIIVRVSAFTSGTYTVTIQGKDPVSGQYYNILTGTAIGSVSTNTLTVYPGIAVTANVSASAVLPRTWRVSLAGAASQNMTLSVGASLIQ